jgi:hypothetical protein
MTEPDPGREARLAETAGQKARTARLTAEHGTPEHLSASGALALAAAAHLPVDPRVTADDVYASVYLDDAAADAWGESNRVHHGLPTLATVPLPDRRVVGILDLRPSLERAREES